MFQDPGQCCFIGLSCSIPTIVFYFFLFLFFLSVGLYCGAGVFGLIGCISLYQPIFFNNNNNNKYLQTYIAALKRCISKSASKELLYLYQLLLLLLKPAVQAQVEKTKVFKNSFCNSTSTCTTVPQHNSGKPPMVDCTLEPIQCSGVKHSVGKVISQSNLSWQERPAAALVCQMLVEADGSLLNRQ